MHCGMHILILRPLTFTIAHQKNIHLAHEQSPHGKDISFIPNIVYVYVTLPSTPIFISLRVLCLSVSMLCMGKLVSRHNCT